MIRVIRRVLATLAIVGMLGVSAASAEDVCVDAGTIGPATLDVPAVCIPVP